MNAMQRNENEMQWNADGMNAMIWMNPCMKWMIECIHEMHECMNEMQWNETNECMHARINVWMHACVHDWVNETKWMQW